MTIKENNLPAQPETPDSIALLLIVSHLSYNAFMSPIGG